MTDYEKKQRRRSEREQMREAAVKAFPLYLRSVHRLTDAQCSGRENFRCLNPSHEDSTASMRLMPDGKRVHCFGCGCTFDLPQLIAEDNGTTVSAPETWAILSQWAKWTTGTGAEPLQAAPDVPKTIADSPPIKEKKQIDNTRFYQVCAGRRSESRFLQYWTGRGLTLETAERFNIGYAPKWSQRYYNIGGTTPRIIIPATKYSYTARYCGDTVPEGIEKVRKSGKSELFNTAAARQDSPLVITEGEFDAMSIEQCGTAALALGGCANVNKLLLAAPELFANRTQRILIMTDADKAGQDAAARILTGLHGLRRNKQIPAFIIRIFTAYPDSCKDPNELLIECPDRLKAILRNIGSNGEGF